MSGAFGDPIILAERWLDEPKSVALATVIETSDSSPRGCGAHMLIAADGHFVGSVSGGCVEATIIEVASAAIADGKLRQLEFGVQDDSGWKVGLSCGGKIKVLIEPLSGPMTRASFGKLNALRRAGHTIVRAVDLSTGKAVLMEPADDGTPLASAAAEAVHRDRNSITQIDGCSWFLRVYGPPFELVIIGAVHIAQALCRMAALLDFRVRVIDPRTSFATLDRFPDVPLRHDFPDQALDSLTVRSAVAVLSHDPKIDDPALIAALRSPAFYIGALGSKRTQAARLQRLRAHGIPDAALNRIHGPVGLAIGAKTPEEIAISILAEIIQARRKPA